MNTHFAEEDGCLLLRDRYVNNYYFYYPLSAAGDEIAEERALEKIEAYCRANNVRLHFTAIPREKLPLLALRYGEGPAHFQHPPAGATISTPPKTSRPIPAAGTAASATTSINSKRTTRTIPFLSAPRRTSPNCARSCANIPPCNTPKATLWRVKR